MARMNVVEKKFSAFFYCLKVFTVIIHGHSKYHALNHLVCHLVVVTLQLVLNKCQRHLAPLQNQP
ncbi:MAG TPA: hypothetical protein DDY31_16070 [Lachnospiraceae bacterium]|nr:hypothetical protein [Lachnospiraceae bacterium]